MGPGTSRSRDRRLGIDDRVEDLLGTLTAEQKAGQLTSRALPDNGRLDPTELDPPPGFVVIPPSHWRDSAVRVRALQEQLTAPGSGGIPALVITLRAQSGAVRYPNALARAATWDRGLAEEMAAAAATETRAGGATARVGPVLATVAGPRPAAVADRDQCLGGDPVLTAELVAAYVRGAQGPVPGRIRDGGAALVISHLGATAAQLAGLPADAHERWMRATALVAAEAAVTAGAMIALPTSSANAAVPGHADSWLLRDVLRRDWGFDGVVLAAPGAVDGLVTEHRVAADVDTAYALALEAGVDVVGTDADGPTRLARLVRQGKLPSWLLDDAVRAVLRLKVTLGLFDDAGPIDAGDAVGGPAHRALARRATTGSIVLLADTDRILPLVGTTAVDVLCVGRCPLALPDTSRLASALAVALPGCVVRDRGGVAAAEEPDLADTVVAVIPGDPCVAATVVSRIVATGRLCVALVCSGDVDGAPALAASTAAVLLCWRPLADHADAVADVLTGATEPGGRLPLRVDDRFPLGHGMGYTTFEYSQLQVGPNPSTGSEPVQVTFRLTNTGSRAGKEIAQVYVSDHVSSVRQDARRLAGFAAVHLAAGQSKRVRITVPPSRLAVWNRTMRRVVEPGDFDVHVGRSALDLRLSCTFAVSSGGEAAAHAFRRA